MTASKRMRSIILPTAPPMMRAQAIMCVMESVRKSQIRKTMAMIDEIKVSTMGPWVASLKRPKLIPLFQTMTILKKGVKGIC